MGTHPAVGHVSSAVPQGTDWLLMFANVDGSIGPVEGNLYYYQVPWTSAVMDEFAAASRLLDWTYHNCGHTKGSL